MAAFCPSGWGVWTAGVPAVIGADGIEEIVEMDLTEEEKSQFAHSCDVIRGYLKKAKEMLS